MKKHSHFRNNDGFFLPYVVVLAAIIMATIVHISHLYNNELKISYNLIEQIEYETFYQIGMEKFLQDKPYERNNTGEVTYVLPTSKVDISYYFTTEDTVKVDLLVYGKKDHMYHFYRDIKIEN